MIKIYKNQFLIISFILKFGVEYYDIYPNLYIFPG